MRRAVLFGLLLTLAGCDSFDIKQQQPAAHAHQAGADLGPAARALDQSMQRMHAGMGVASADPDESFMRMMIPHHRGAIDMARIELEHGKDAQARRLAEQIIASQSREIAEIEGWLAKRKQR